MKRIVSIFLLAIAVVFACTNGQAATLEERTAAAADAMALDPADSTPEAAKDREATRAAMAVATEKVKPEVAALLAELEGMRSNKAFHKDGFSTAMGADWKKRVEALRSRIEKDDGIAMEIRTSPAALLGLAWEWIRHKGAMTDMAKQYLGEVRTALAWKLAE